MTVTIMFRRYIQKKLKLTEIRTIITAGDFYIFKTKNGGSYYKKEFIRVLYVSEDK